MINNGIGKFLSDTVEKANYLKGLEDTELTAWHYTGRKRTGMVEIVQSPATDSYAQFWTRQVPRNWYRKIKEFSPRILVEGELKDLSVQDSKKVMNSLAALPDVVPRAAEKFSIINVYDNSEGITAMWQRAGWGEVLRNMLSTKVPANKLHEYVDRLAKKSSVTNYAVRGETTERSGEKGVRVHTSDTELIKIFKEFTFDKNAVIKQLQLGGVNDELEIKYEDAKKLVFSTPLKSLSYAEINCISHDGNFLRADTDVGAVYVDDEELRVKAKTPAKMMGIIDKLM
jgi:hypothetical protein